jgi:hypothetical protein
MTIISHFPQSPPGGPGGDCGKCDGDREALN